LSHQGRYEEALVAVEKGMPLACELGARREIGLGNVILGMIHLGKNDFVKAGVCGKKCVKQYQELNQQEEMALGLAVLVYTQLGLGRSRDAINTLCDTLQIGLQIRGLYPVLYVLFGAARILIDKGKVEKGLEISALAERYPFIGNSQWFDDVAGREIKTARDKLPPEVVAAAQERGRAREIWQTAAELLDEFR
jgi:hypothetical protein